MVREVGNSSIQSGCLRAKDARRDELGFSVATGSGSGNGRCTAFSFPYFQKDGLSSFGIKLKILQNCE